MKKFLLITLLIFCTITISSQRISAYDTILVESCYKAFYSHKIQTSSFVIYKLYKGGGDVTRSGMNFKTKDNLPHFNYTNSGYDRGHLVPAEDFAYDKKLMQNTFYYHNVIPQTIKLNRGNWKRFENAVRNASQEDSLIIICGGCDYNKKLIPKKCFKIVYSLSTKELKYCILVNNDDHCSFILNKQSMVKRFTFNYIMNLFKKGNS